MVFRKNISNIHKIFFYLLLVLLPTQLGLHFWPDWALVLGRRVDYLSPTLYGTDVLIILMLLFWLTEKVYGDWCFVYREKKKFVFPHIPDTKTQILFLFIFINIFFAANRMVALFAWIKILEMIALGFYIVKEKPKLPEIIFPLSVGVLYSSVIAITQFLLQHSIGGLFWFLGERTFSASTPGIARVDFPSFFKLRAYATFPHPNVLGGFLAILLPLIIYQLSNLPIIQFKNKKQIFYIVTSLLGIIALILTFSRSAWIVFVLGISYIACLPARQVYRKKKKLFIPAFLSVLLIALVIGKTFGFQDESVVVREQLSVAALSMARASPVLGTGLGNYLVRLPDYLVSRQIYFLQPVHNIYLLLLSEVGIVGFGFFVLLLKKILSYRAYRISYVYAILLLGLVDHYFLTLQQGQLLLTIFLSLSLIQ
jgi:O-antigen ligase